MTTMTPLQAALAMADRLGCRPVTPAEQHVVALARAVRDGAALLRQSACQCGDCNGAGVIEHADPERSLSAGDACPDCGELWQFIERIEGQPS
jgi:hypothetical protein